MAYPPEISERLDNIAHASSSRFEATGAHANLDCGCVVRFGLSVDAGNGCVAEAGFSSNGCGYMVAAAEIAAAAIANLPLAGLKGNAAAAIERHLCEAFGEEVPASRRECLASVVRAAATAFVRQRTQQLHEFRGEVALICTCFGVTEDRVREAITGGRARSVEQVGEATNAGTGCGSCQMLIRELLDECVHQASEFDAW